MENKNLKQTYRTDLAYDEVEHLGQTRGEHLQTFNKEILDINGVNVYKLTVDEQSSHYLNKKPGFYYTIDLSEENYHDYKRSEIIEKSIATVIKEAIEQLGMTGKKCLVVGLGNVNVTPDAVGPYVLDNVIVTRHLFNDATVSSKYSEVSGISPGVMGNTGIETFDIVQSVIDKIDVDYVIVVDALASSSILRVNRTVQITDTGISPGSGVGNKRKEISKETVGKPVIAIGIPTVVDFVTITSEVIDLVLRYLQMSVNGDVHQNFLAKEKIPQNLLEQKEPSQSLKEHFLGEIGKLTEQEKRELIHVAITDNGYNMIVTPKDVDLEIEDLSKIIAMSLNLALHNHDE